jgi:hypothetical protein
MAAPQAGGGNRRALIFAGVGVGLLVVFFLGTKLLGGGGGSKSPTLTVPPQAAGVGAGATTTTTSPAGAPAGPETFEVFNGKNPFQPPSGLPTGATTTGGTTTGGTSTGGTTTGGTATSGTATSGTATSGGTSTSGTATSGTATTTTGSNEPRRAQRVALLDVFVNNGQREANVRVNDTVYQDLEPGDAFATSYKVVLLQDKCGTFLFGDSQFRLCEGEEVLK